MYNKENSMKEIGNQEDRLIVNIRKNNSIIRKSPTNPQQNKQIKISYYGITTKTIT